MIKVGDWVKFLVDNPQNASIIKGQILPVTRVHPKHFEVGNDDALWLVDNNMQGHTWELYTGPAIPPKPPPPYIGIDPAYSTSTTGWVNYAPTGRWELGPLPKGQMNFNLDEMTESEPVKPKKRCECGQSDDVGVKHSDWCVMYTKEIKSTEVEYDEQWD